MTTITPDHNSGICHAASENRRRILDRLKELAYQLENCDKEEPVPVHTEERDFDKVKDVYDNDVVDNSDECSTLGAVTPPNKPKERTRSRSSRQAIYDGGGHAYQNKYNPFDFKKTPASVFPDYDVTEAKQITPPERLKFNVERTKSRALIGGVLVTGCDCVRRNGLQDRCKRTECQGRPECMTRPEPSCAPSMGSMNVAREESADQKQIPKPYLKVCCKCPPDCHKQNEQEDC